MMSKTRFLTIALLLLGLLNLGLVAFVFFSHKPPRPEGPRRIIIERLNFDEEQTARYDELIRQHRTDVRNQESTIAQSKQHLYALLKSDSLSYKDSLIAQIGKLQEGIENIHFQHFQGIKSICRPEQLPLFNQLADELAGFFGSPKPKMRPK